MTSHYQDRHEFYDGAVIVFKRGDAVSEGDKRFFQARFKIDGRIGFKTISLKTRNYEDAVAKAKSTYLQMTQTVKDGGSIDTLNFNKAWKDWYAFMIAEHAWSESRERWHLDYFNRYFNAYFGQKKLDEITNEFANGYWQWRRRYWIDGEGVNQVYNRQRKAVAYKTLQMEQSALNGFFQWAYSTKRWIRYPVKLKVVASKRSKDDSRRATFSNAEWNILTRNLLSWADGKGKYVHDRLNEYHRHYRRQLRFYVLFLASTGIRSGTETRFMKWEDIEFATDHLKIRIRSATKLGKPRTVISQPHAVAWLHEWRSMSHYNGPQDYVWYGNSRIGEPQKVATDLNKTFQAFLKTVEYRGRKDGLEFDADGKKRSLYSLRHFYATQRLLHGVSYEDLRRNMGTSIEQLVKHYDWATTEQRAAEITKTRFRERQT